ncbi:hypothetical protein L218DRAFT_170792 [Marasmius fiardii PR-910]|nr:hypothetical protein L218DRAFT_170792 [Marasmius fiardii PR-910]
MPFPHLRTVSVFLVLFLVFSSLRLFANAKTVNRTIDDFYGDEETGLFPTYYPLDGVTWHQNCKAEDGCVILADESEAWNGTWHSATYRQAKMDNMGVTLQFNGTAIWVYFILANNLPKATTYTQCNFTLDGEPMGQFIHKPDASKTELDYNAEVFSRTELEPKRHKLEIMTGNLTREVYMNFDYAKYTTEVPDVNVNGNNNTTTVQDDGTNSKKAPVGVIVGCVIGGVLLSFIIALVFFVIRRKRSRSKHTEVPQPFSQLLVPRRSTRPLPQVLAPKKQLSDLSGQERDNIVQYNDGDVPQLYEEVRQMRGQLATLRNEMENPPPEYHR